MAFGIKKLAPIVVILAVALWSVWPAVVNPSGVADFGSDGWFINWVMNRQRKNVSDYIRNPRLDFEDIFQGNIFYPNKNVLAYSELFTLSGLTAYITGFLSEEPGVVSGAILVLGQVATMLVIYLMWSDLTKNEWASAVGTVAFGLSQIRWEYQVHLQMWGMQYWLLSSWLLSSWLVDKKHWKLYTGVVLLGLQAWESVLPVYFAIVTLTIFSIFNFPFGFAWGKQFLKHVLISGVFFGVTVWPVVGVYRSVARENNFVRTIRDAAAGGTSVDDLVGKFASPGLYILLVVSVIRLFKSQISMSREAKWLALILIFGLVMAMGPVLKWRGETVRIGGYPIPLPYAAVYYLVPGMGAFRTPSRWLWLSGLAGSGLVAIAIGNFQFSIFNFQSIFKLSNFQFRKLCGLGGCLLVAVVGGARLTRYAPLPRLAQFPAVYKWLATLPGKVIVEFPMGGDRRESERMYYSLLHNKYLVNGFSGFEPLGWKEWKDKGVDYVVVNKEGFEIYDLRFMNIMWEDEKYLVLGR